jgi:hypothetical protein
MVRIEIIFLGEYNLMVQFKKIIGKETIDCGIIK